MKEYFYDGYYIKEYPKQITDDKGNIVEIHQPLGFLIAGYSANERQAECWILEVDEAGACSVTQRFSRTGEYGAEAKGQPEPLYRLTNGWSPRVLSGLVQSGIPRDEALKFLQGLPMEPLVQPGMPIQDAIDLTRSRFKPGAPSVHEPLDIAAITYHEGFRWVQRKHYFSRELNPPHSPNTTSPSGGAA